MLQSHVSKLQRKEEVRVGFKHLLSKGCGILVSVVDNISYNAVCAVFVYYLGGNGELTNSGKVYGVHFNSVSVRACDSDDCNASVFYGCLLNCY